MTIYLILLGYILFLPMLGRIVFVCEQKRKKFILRFGMLAIFLILALKGETVGVDILGYKEEYELSKTVSWGDFRYVYFEPGYILLMQIFSKFGISFQVFNICIYAFSCYAMYCFIKQYSLNTTFSLLIFVCYQFFVFYISGLRQMLAMSICIFAFLLLNGVQYKPWTRWILSILLVLVASTMHESALVFLVVLPVTRLKTLNLSVLILGPIMGSIFLFRRNLLSLLSQWIGSFKDAQAATLGNNYYLLILLAIFGGVGVLLRRRRGMHVNVDSNVTSMKRENDFLIIAVNMLWLTIALQFLFANTQLFRGNMYSLLFVIPGLTHVVKSYGSKIEALSTMVLGVLFIYIFVNETLLPNQFEICPYVLFGK